MTENEDLRKRFEELKKRRKEIEEESDDLMMELFLIRKMPVQRARFHKPSGIGWIDKLKGVDVEKLIQLIKDKLELEDLSDKDRRAYEQYLEILEAEIQKKSD